MTNAEMVGKAQTVLGPIDGESLGITLPHEHLLADSTFLFVEPADDRGKVLAHQPVGLKNLNWVLHHLFGNVDNLRLVDEQMAVDELIPFKQAGGRTVVEMSVRGLAGNPLGLARISKATGINVIMATGYYVAMAHPKALASMTEEEVACELVRDVTVGIGHTGVRAGYIKAACGGAGGSPTRIEESDRKVLLACALAQRRTGAALGIHNMRKDLVAEIMEILSDADADLDRTVMIHADRWGSEPPIFPKLLQAGCYLELDGFGTAELGLVPAPGFEYQINDAQRCDMIVRLIAQGYLRRILISQDVWIKTRCNSYGGAGYAHILLNAVPLMRHKGISDKQIHTLLVENPRRLLAFAPAKE
jgi:phosphotriesterase-related protein